MFRRISSGFLATSKPATAPQPEVGVSSPQSIRMTVDLPAPLGPRKPKISPVFTWKETWSTATKSPKVLTRSWISRAGVIVVSRCEFLPWGRPSFFVVCHVFLSSASSSLVPGSQHYLCNLAARRVRSTVYARDPHGRKHRPHSFSRAGPVARPIQFGALLAAGCPHRQNCPRGYPVRCERPPLLRPLRLGDHAEPCACSVGATHRLKPVPPYALAEGQDRPDRQSSAGAQWRGLLAGRVLRSLDSLAWRVGGRNPLCRGQPRQSGTGEHGRAMALVQCPIQRDRKSTRLNSSHLGISYAVFC